MTFARILALVAFVSFAASCDLLNTSTDSTLSSGRGAKFFDPYSSKASGAISLSLMYFNGCSILPDGTAVSRGTLNLPDYPTDCPQRGDDAFSIAPAPATSTMALLRGQPYFLNQFIAVDMVYGMHTDFNDRTAPATWIRKQSRFKHLDWTGLSVSREEWRPVSLPSWQRETYFENAAWMLRQDSNFKVDVLDRDGTVRASQTYSRNDFLAENPFSGRTRFSWMVDFILPPAYPGDPVLHPGDRPTVYQTTAKVAYSTSTNPFKTFTVPDIDGEGVIRVTWNLLPDEPFYFPVKFVTDAQVQSDRTCYKIGADGFATDERVPCTFGLTQEARLSKPQNGKFFKPGEAVDFQVSIRDGDGNGLHPKDFLPSLNEFKGQQSNGLLYFSDFTTLSLREVSSSESGFMVAGPLDKMRLTPRQVTTYFRTPDDGEPHYYVEPPGIREILPGAGDAKAASRFTVPLPQNAQPGTYVLYIKAHRYFMGERLNRLDAVFFQVGQEQPTNYPGRVGNCQICHRGVISMTNIMHGLSVDHVEGCKACHNENVVGYIADLVHHIHSSSTKYPQPLRDCSVCHLKRESATTPSIAACQGCHPSIHGSTYFDLQFSWVDEQPNAYTACGEACHVTSVPNQHILPAN